MIRFNRCLPRLRHRRLRALSHIKSNNVENVVGQFFISRRNQGTNFGVWNPSSYIREKRNRDPGFMEGMTRTVLRPRLTESIIPAYALPAKEAPPWPYKEKGYKYFHKYWDGTLKRFDENTRLIVVEGNVGTGCEKFAAELADKLGFYHIRQPKIEDILIDRYGVDKRDYYHLLPEKFCFFDTEMFFIAPDHPMVTLRAFLLFRLKCEAYCNAIAHLLNTGQGVVMDRHAFTDVAFVRAMSEKGFVNGEYGNLYPRMRAQALNFTCYKLLPHLLIYLDCPPSVCMENVKKRARPWEIDSKVIDYDYFCAIEAELKQHLKRASRDSEVMMLDWKQPADVDSIANEIYKIDFAYDWNINERFYEWNNVSIDPHWNKIRYESTNKVISMSYFNQTFIQVPQLVVYPDETIQLRYFVENVIGKYAPGYNRSRGDKLMEVLFGAVDQPATGNWTEYLPRDNFFVVPRDSATYVQMPYEPNIPEEEFQPRRFNPACLKDWNLAHH